VIWLTLFLNRTSNSLNEDCKLTNYINTNKLKQTHLRHFQRTKAMEKQLQPICAQNNCNPSAHTVRWPHHGDFIANVIHSIKIRATSSFIVLLCSQCLSCSPGLEFVFLFNRCNQTSWLHMIRNHLHYKQQQRLIGRQLANETF